MQLHGSLIGVRAIILYIALLLALIGAIVADAQQMFHWYLAMGVLLPVWFLASFLFGWTHILFVGIGSMFFAWPTACWYADLTQDSDEEAGWGLLAFALIVAFVDVDYIKVVMGKMDPAAHMVAFGIAGMSFFGCILLWADDSDVADVGSFDPSDYSNYQGCYLFLWTILFLVSDLNSSKFGTVLATFMSALLQYTLLDLPIADRVKDVGQAGGVFGWVATLVGFLYMSWKVTGKGIGAVAELRASWKTLRVLLLLACSAGSLFGAFFGGDKSRGWLSVNAMVLPLVLLHAHVEGGDRQELIYFFALGLGLVVSPNAWVFADRANEAEDDSESFGHAMHIITSWACWVAVAPFDKLRDATLGMGCIKSLLHWVALAAHGASVLGAIIIWGYVDEQNASGQLEYSVTSLMCTFMFFAYQNFFVENADIAAVFAFFFTFVQGILMTIFLSFNDNGGPDSATMEAGSIICWTAIVVYTLLTVYLGETAATKGPSPSATAEPGATPTTGAEPAAAGPPGGAPAPAQVSEPASGVYEEALDPEAPAQHEDEAETYDTV